MDKHEAIGSLIGLLRKLGVTPHLRYWYTEEGSKGYVINELEIELWSKQILSNF